MKVRDIMTAQPTCCGPEMNLAAATELLWKKDCGALPVVDDGRLAGIVTDRDICITLGTRGRLAAEIKVGEIATHDVQTCSPEDDVNSAMAGMRRAKVHRLPVVGVGGKLVGIVALNDLALAASRKQFEIDYDGVMDTLRAISDHRDGKIEPASSPVSVHSGCSRLGG